MEDLDSIFGVDDAESETECSTEAILRPESSGVLKFHNGTEEAMYRFVVRKAIQGNSASVLKAIDEFCYTQHWMMHIGDHKLPFLLEGISLAESNRKHRSGGTSPFVVVELGSYCGYSAVYIASQLSAENGDLLYCIEGDAECVKWTKRMVEFACLDTVVQVVHSSAADINTWKVALGPKHIDLLFIDHDKARYLADLLLIEEAGLFRSASVVVADNVLSFGVPLTDYLNHVRDPNGPFQISVMHEGLVEYVSDADRNNCDKYKDGVEISTYK